MQINNRSFIIFCVISIFSIFTESSVKAFWFAEPKDKIVLIDHYGSSLGIVFESGYRKISAKNGIGMLDYNKNQVDEVIPGTDKHVKLKTQRVYLYGAGELTKHITTFIRFMPGAGIIRPYFDYTPYNPILWGSGVGMQISSPEIKKDLYVGVTISWDYIFGVQKNMHTYPSVKLSEDFTTLGRNDKIFWSETSFASWLSHRGKYEDIYCGVSYISTKISLSLGEGYISNWRLDNNIGGIFGIQFYPSKKSSIGVETHFINENSIALRLNYLY
jgi:hypothetical protein